ncbi:MAG: N-formylglutamate amidohydrolase [Rhizobacter sp.]|nr:N-formylglutamate amidohydrolase [Bacteriovorax sp.]
MKNVFLIFTCEHASNSIPAKYKKYFTGKKSILASHRGFDWGTEYLGKSLGKNFKAPVIYGNFSRLLIDLNRHETHKTALSDMTKNLSPDEQETVRRIYHRPHWNEVKKIIADQIKKGKTVLHIGVHSFTPVLYGDVRTCDLGVLYDSRRTAEAEFARVWQKSLRVNSELRVRRNYPYLGKYDGLTSEFRRMYSEKQYKGFEIEVNQSLAKKSTDLKMIEKILIKSLQDIL